MSNWKITICIDKKINVPLYKQISQSVMRAVESGQFTPGTQLPGARTLAAILKLNRNTVVQAYEDLVLQGWIEFQHGTRPKISESIQTSLKSPKRKASKENENNEKARFLLKLTDGYPDSRLFPMEVFSRTFGRIARLYGHRLYSADLNPQGSLALRSGLAEMLHHARNMDVDADNLLVTRGSQQAIYLLGIALAKLGTNNIVVESPGYAHAAYALQASGLSVEKQKIDEEGFDVDGLEEKLKKGLKVSAVYLTPHHQYPTTVTLKANRRLKILELAERYNFWIVEDDYDHDFHYDASPVFPIASIRSNKVIYLSSLSKVLSVGLRVGYVVAPKEVLTEILNAKSLMDRIGDPLLEKTLAEFIQDGELLRHVNKMRILYKTRRDALWDDLKEDFSNLKKPLGGMAFWLPLNGKSHKNFSSLMADQGIQVVGEEQMSFFKESLTGTRIGFAGLDDKERKLLVDSLREMKS